MRNEDIKACANGIKLITDSYGTSVLDDARLFASLFNDFVNFNFEGKEIIISTLRTPVLNNIKDVCDSQSKQISAKKLEHYLDSTLGLKEEWICSILQIYSLAFDWGLTFSPKKNTDSFKSLTLNDIRTFAFDGSDLDAIKTDGPVFLTNETQYIGVLVTFDPEPEEFVGKFTWQIFKEDGTAFTEKLIRADYIPQNCCSYYASWGWDTKGNWPEGKYKIVASMNGSNELTTYFDIQYGAYDNAALDIKNVKLFSAGERAPELSKRSYGTVFSKATTERIYFQLDHKEIKNTFYTTVNYTIRNSYNEIVGSYAIPVHFMRGWNMCWISHGYDVAGQWDTGDYSYVLSIGNGKNYYGTFSIV